MKLINALLMTILFVVAGCSEPAMPEVNGENCKRENILKLQPESLRREFGSKCFRRNTFKPTKSPKAWGADDL